MSLDHPNPEAGGCLDGKHHLSLTDVAGNSGMKSLADGIGAFKGDPTKPKPKPNSEHEKKAGPPLKFIHVPSSSQFLKCAFFFLATHRWCQRRH